MDKLSAFESFVVAVQSGSLSGAARKRKLSQPAISQQINALESDFRTRLLHRSRNGIQMTQAGELLYKHALAMLDQHAELNTELETLSGRVTGRLTVTANPGLSQYVLADVIVDLAHLHPDLDIVLRADTRILDLGAEGIDIALRSGAVGDGSGVVRKIATMSKLHVATPQYLDQVGRPQSPDELINLEYIQFRVGDDQIATRLSRGETIVQAPIKIGFTAQYPDLITKALYGNLGYAKMPGFLIEQAIQQGQLEVLLPEWKIPETDLYMVFADRERRTPSYTAFVNALLDKLERTLGIELLPSTKQMRRQLPKSD